MTSLAEFKAQFGGGARPTLYKVTINFPTAIQSQVATEKLQFTCKGAQIPGATAGLIEVYHMGRTVKLAGDRTFQPINLTVVNDVDWITRSAFERWMAYINNHSENRGAVRPSDYMVDAFIEQLDRNGDTIASYTLIGAYPEDLSPVELGFDQVDTLEEYNVTLQYQWWVRPEISIT